MSKKRLKNWKIQKKYKSENVENAESLKGINHYYNNVESDAVIKEIEKEVKQINADLLIMMRNNMGFGTLLFIGVKPGLWPLIMKCPCFQFPCKFNIIKAFLKKLDEKFDSYPRHPFKKIADYTKRKITLGPNLSITTKLAWSLVPYQDMLKLRSKMANWP